MTQDDLNELKCGKEWNEELIHQVKNVPIPTKFSFLERRIHQLRCNSLLSNATSQKLHKTAFRYILGIGYITYLLIKSRFLKKKITSSFSIWDSDIDSHVTCDKFNDFLNSNQVVDLKNENFIFVKSGKYKNHYQSSIYSPNPIYEILGYLNISFLDSLVCIKEMWRNFFTYLQISLKCPGHELLFKDFLTEPIIKTYLKNGLVNFYRTNSNLNSQEYWCEDINFNTVWYSTNSRTIQYKNLLSLSIPEHPILYFSFYGVSWVWNDSSAAWLNKFKHNVNHVVGPIMFYGPSKSIIKNNSKKRLLIFDVTPFKEKFLRDHHLHKGIIYNNEQTCIKFISDILSTMHNKDWEIVLKPKRKYNDYHSEKYIKYLDEMENGNKNFHILSTQTNLFDEVYKADLVISIPLSSPFDIAKFMKIPSFYYDPTDDVDFRTMGYTEDDYFKDLDSFERKVVSLS